MYTEFDYLFDKKASEEKFVKYFSEFSSETRKRLLAKNYTKPENLYDVFYTKIKEDQLSRNTTIIEKDLEESSKPIRDMQMMQVAESLFNLEEQSEGFRKSMLSRGAIHESVSDLNKIAIEKKKELLSKNNGKERGLLEISEKFRKDSLSKNYVSVSEKLIEEQKKEQYKNINLSKNIGNENVGLEEVSNSARLNQLSKNETKGVDIEKSLKIFKEENLSKNTNGKNNLDNSSESYKNLNLDKNVPINKSIDTDAEINKKNNLSKNVSNGSQLDEISNLNRKNNLSKNIPIENSIDSNLKLYRDNLEKQNVPQNIDLEKLDLEAKKENISKNKQSENDIESDSVIFRETNLNLNVQKNNDTEKESKIYKENNLGQNIPNNTDLEKDSLLYKNNNLSLNIPKNSNIENNSFVYRNENLNSNISNNSDIETDSVSYREDDLAANIPINSDIETNSVPYREDDLAANVPINSDIETDSVPYREGDLVANVPINSDIETDSVPYREDGLAANVPINSDIETDSVPYREDDLVANVPINSDIETDSVPYREDDLVANVPINSDIETDSVPYREDDLAANVPINSDIETDSVPYREDDLVANVPINSDIETDSVPYREDDLAANVPTNSDIETDSVLYREDDLSLNVNSNYSIDSHINFYGENGTSFAEKQGLLEKNLPSENSIDSFIGIGGARNSVESIREDNLSRNSGGMLGFNVFAFGQSQYIGFSGLLAQGLIFRNLSMMRNKPGGFFYDGEVTGIDEFYDINTGSKTTIEKVRQQNLNRMPRQSSFYADLKYNERLLQNTLQVPYTSEVLYGGMLPFTSPEIINQIGFISHTYEFAITSPMERNMTVAFDRAKRVGDVLEKNFGIDGYDNFGVKGKRKTIDYSLDNGFSFSSGLKTEVEYTASDYNNNINNLLRQYLKSLNFYSLKDGSGSIDDFGLQVKNIDSLRNNSNIIDLVNAYGLFKKDGKIVSTEKKMPVNIDPKSPENYFTRDVETYFDPNYREDDNKSIVYKKEAGNPFYEEFKGRKKGVFNVLKRVSEDSTVKYSRNVKDVQGVRGESSKIFISVEKGKEKTVRQKFTLENPYPTKDLKTGKIVFYIKNYSIPPSQGNVMYFPPFISSFSNSESANYNSTVFLGRPEPVYTYNNSSREGNISFFVLTDYGQDVIIGRDYGSDDMEQIKIDGTDVSMVRQNNISLYESINIIDDQISSLNQKISELRDKNNQNNIKEDQNIKTPENNPEDTENNEQLENSGGIDSNNDGSENESTLDGLYQQKQALEKRKGNLQNELEKVDLQEIEKTAYSEVNSLGQNTYSMGMGTSESDDNGYKVYKPDITKDKIEEMIASLAFQPAYFSGSLIDFKKRMEFLTKTTRPARNDNFPVKDEIGARKVDKSSGFSFTKPPICHLRLGDWIDHDVVIDSVSYNDYGNWSVGSEKVQPMWVNVSLQFKIIGSAGVDSGRPLTSTDKGGFFGTVTSY